MRFYNITLYVCKIVTKIRKEETLEFHEEFDLETSIIKEF